MYCIYEARIIVSELMTTAMSKGQNKMPLLDSGSR